jgi:hypothetical protein
MPLCVASDGQARLDSLRLGDTLSLATGRLRLEESELPIEPKRPESVYGLRSQFMAIQIQWRTTVPACVFSRSQPMTPTPAAAKQLIHLPNMRRKVYGFMIFELERPREEHDRSGLEDARETLAHLICQDIARSPELLLAAAKTLLENTQ